MLTLESLKVKQSESESLSSEVRPYGEGGLTTVWFSFLCDPLCWADPTDGVIIRSLLNKLSPALFLFDRLVT